MKRVFYLFLLMAFTGLSFAQTAGSEKWHFDTGDFIFGAPAIGSDGTVYAASNDHYLYAINPDGSQKWKFDMGNGAYGSPAIGADGTIYIGTAGIGKLFAVNPDGSKKWESEQADGWIDDSPAIAVDGTIIFGTTNQNFYGINPDGSTRWKLVANSNFYSSPAIATDGTIYMGLEYGKFSAFNPDGSLKWELAIGAVESSPAIGADGTVYVGSTDNNLYAINPDGTQKWSFHTGMGIYASPAIGADGTIYVGSFDTKFYAVNPDGTEKWHLATDESIGSFQHSDSPAIGADGMIYITASDTATFTFKKFLYAIDPNGSVQWRFYADAISGPPAIANDGTVYVGSYGGTLYAINSNSKGLANSPWPRFRHDNRGTGNMQTVTAIRQLTAPVPEGFQVSEVYPNPFNPTAHIKFSLEKTGRVRVDVFNSAGQLVDRLFDAVQNSGSYELNWDASAYGSGLYFIRMSANGRNVTRKALLVK